MNWQKIRTKYPEADNAFLDWWHRINNADFPVNGFKTRDLYDFFDSHGIQLFIYPSAGKMKTIDLIRVGNSDISNVSDKSYKTRVDAESAAFEKGFQLLEKKLKK